VLHCGRREKQSFAEAVNIPDAKVIAFDPLKMIVYSLGVGVSCP